MTTETYQFHYLKDEIALLEQTIEDSENALEIHRRELEAKIKENQGLLKEVNSMILNLVDPIACTLPKKHAAVKLALAHLGLDLGNQIEAPVVDQFTVDSFWNSQDKQKVIVGIGISTEATAPAMLTALIDAQIKDWQAMLTEPKAVLILHDPVLNDQPQNEIPQVYRLVNSLAANKQIALVTTRQVLGLYASVMLHNIPADSVRSDLLKAWGWLNGYTPIPKL